MLKLIYLFEEHLLKLIFKFWNTCIAPQKPPPIIKDQDRGDENGFRGHHTASV
jgi:hypothetical protein